MSLFSPSFLALVAVAAILYRLYLSSRKSTAGVVLPPGPKPVPVLGNILDLTAHELWLRALPWAQKYGSITYLRVFSQPLIFLNTPTAVFDLLDKRGSIYSDKPQLTMACDLCGCGDMVAFTGYGSKSRRQRKLLNLAFASTRIPTYHSLIGLETRNLLRRLLAPKDPSMTEQEAQTLYVSLVRRYAGQLTLSVVYGYKTRGNDDPFLNLAEECVDILSNDIAGGGGIWPVDIIPSLRYLPEWCPGSGFLTKARKWKAKMTEFVDRPYEYVLQSMKNNTHEPSFCSTLLEDAELNPSKKSDSKSQFEQDLKWTANSMYSASGDTTITTISYFLLQLALHPHVLQRAREELDHVLTSNNQIRLPTFSDRSSLPYCEAIYRETLRHNAPVPLSLPHRLMEDDIYLNPSTGKETFLPKGSLIFANVYAITRDPSLWPAPPSHPQATPDDFCPERHLVEPPCSTEEEKKRWLKARDPSTYVFGFGRRQCPGQNLVDSSAWYLMVCLMASVDWSLVKKPEEVKVTFDNSVFRTPSKFGLDVRPRNEEWLRLVSAVDEGDD